MLIAHLSLKLITQGSMKTSSCHIYQPQLMGEVGLHRGGMGCTKSVITAVVDTLPKMVWEHKTNRLHSHQFHLSIHLSKDHITTGRVSNRKFASRIVYQSQIGKRPCHTPKSSNTHIDCIRVSRVDWCTLINNICRQSSPYPECHSQPPLPAVMPKAFLHNLRKRCWG